MGCHSPAKRPKQHSRLLFFVLALGGSIKKPTSLREFFLSLLSSWRSGAFELREAQTVIFTANSGLGALKHMATEGDSCYFQGHPCPALSPWATPILPISPNTSKLVKSLGEANAAYSPVGVKVSGANTLRGHERWTKWIWMETNLDGVHEWIWMRQQRLQQCGWKTRRGQSPMSQR